MTLNVSGCVRLFSEMSPGMSPKCIWLLVRPSCLSSCAFRPLTCVKNNPPSDVLPKLLGYSSRLSCLTEVSQKRLDIRAKSEWHRLSSGPNATAHISFRKRIRKQKYFVKMFPQWAKLVQENPKKLKFIYFCIMFYYIFMYNIMYVYFLLAFVLC